MITKTFALIFLFASSICQANSLSLSFGPTLNGVIGPKKLLTVGYEFNWGGPSLQLEGGTFTQDGSFTYFGGANIGVHVSASDGWGARIGVGPVGISKADDRLSSILNFHIQARLALEREFWAAGLQLDHFSNANLWPPNLGMDALSLFVSIPLGN